MIINQEIIVSEAFIMDGPVKAIASLNEDGYRMDFRNLERPGG
jgi:hypothetical protein